MLIHRQNSYAPRDKRRPGRREAQSRGTSQLGTYLSVKFNFCRGSDFFLLHSVQICSGANPACRVSFPGEKRPWHETGHSYPPSSKVRNAWSFTSIYNDASPWHRVRFPAWEGDFSLLYSVETGSEARPNSCTIGTAGSFPWGKAAREWSWWCTSI
jgi:hypothetical protein